MLPIENLVGQIKSKIFYEWVDIRARSYTQCFVQILKRNMVLKKATNVGQMWLLLESHL